MIKVTQKIPSEIMLERFDTNEGAALQLIHFQKFFGAEVHKPLKILDIGGGAGYFMAEIKAIFPYASVTVMDLDGTAVTKAREKGIFAVNGSILEPVPVELYGQKFDIVCFNLVLHHIVTGRLFGTRHIQKKSLENASSLINTNGILFIHEICYEGAILKGFPGWMIYLLTSSRLLEPFFNAIGKLSRSLFANTTGIGVRYRSDEGWRKIFSEVQVFSFDQSLTGTPEGHPRLRNFVLGIKSVRRRSYLIRKNLC